MLGKFPPVPLLGVVTSLHDSFVPSDLLLVTLRRGKWWTHIPFALLQSPGLGIKTTGSPGQDKVGSTLMQTTGSLHREQKPFRSPFCSLLPSGCLCVGFSVQKIGTCSLYLNCNSTNLAQPYNRIWQCS